MAEHADPISTAPDRSQPPRQCKNNCGFFGNPSLEGFCSVCFRSLAASRPNGTPSVPASAGPISSAPPVPSSPVPALSVSSQAAGDNCFFCKRHLPLVKQMSCRCGHIFCPKHHFAEDHKCTYDFRSEHQSSIRDQNQKCDFDKVARI